MGTFLLKRSGNSNYFFVLKVCNGVMILRSETFVTKKGCESVIDLVKEYSSYDCHYDRRMSVNSNYYYFNLLTSNGQVIGISEMYSNEPDRELGIEFVKQNGPDSPVLEE